MKKQVSVLLAAVLTASALAGCSSSGTSKETPAASGETTAVQGETGKPEGAGQSAELRVAWWGNQKRTDDTISVFDQFAQQNNVKFTYEYNSFNSYWETLATQSVGNNMPDIITQVTDQFAGYINNGLLVDLSPYVENKTLDLSDCEDAYISGGYYNGGIYGVPLGTNVMTIIYNSELFQAAGVAEPEGNWTW